MADAAADAAALAIDEPIYRIVSSRVSPWKLTLATW